VKKEPEIKENIASERADNAEETTAEENAACEEKADTPSAEELLKKVEELEAQISENNDKYLRLAAEYDNFRRRSREEKDALYDVAMADTVSEFLPLIDNLERAAAFSESDKLKEGLVMIAKSVEGVLEKLKIDTVGAVGETFDPNYHNAVLHDEDENLGEGEITEVFQKGYKKGKKVIRFAMVKTVN